MKYIIPFTAILFFILVVFECLRQGELQFIAYFALIALVYRSVFGNIEISFKDL